MILQLPCHLHHLLLDGSCIRIKIVVDNAKPPTESVTSLSYQRQRPRLPERPTSLSEPDLLPLSPRKTPGRRRLAMVRVASDCTADRSTSKSLSLKRSKRLRYPKESRWEPVPLKLSSLKRDEVLLKSAAESVPQSPIRRVSIDKKCMPLIKPVRRGSVDLDDDDHDGGNQTGRGDTAFLIEQVLRELELLNHSAEMLLSQASTICKQVNEPSPSSSRSKGPASAISSSTTISRPPYPDPASLKTNYIATFSA